MRIVLGGSLETALIRYVDDMRLVAEIADHVLATGMPTPFDWPDVSGRLLQSEDVAAGLLNFARRTPCARPTTGRRRGARPARCSRSSAGA